jgi:hypothetical protein
VAGDDRGAAASWNPSSAEARPIVLVAMPFSSAGCRRIPSRAPSHEHIGYDSRHPAPGDRAGADSAPGGTTYAPVHRRRGIHHRVPHPTQPVDAHLLRERSASARFAREGRDG